METQRDPLSKEKFLQGNRQRWCLIFIGCAFAVLIANIIVPGLDPVPFMQFFLAIGSIFIAGATGDSWVKAYKVGSIRETEVKEETKRIVGDATPEDKPNEKKVEDFEAKYANDPSYAPIQWSRSQEPPTAFREWNKKLN